MKIARTDKSVLGQWWWTVDRLMLAAILALAVFGIVMVSAASPAVAERLGLGSFHFVLRHLIFLIPSLGFLIGISMLSQRGIWRLASVAMIGTLGLMGLTLLIGVEVKGATRWLYFGLVSFQPSEFIKPCFAVVAAWLIARQYDHPSFPGRKVAGGMFGVCLLLLALQPDFGMSFVLSAIFGIQLFLAGLPLSIIALLIGIGVAGILSAYFVFPHVASRIDRFLDPTSGDNYQVQKSLESFSEGGLLGTGPGQGNVKLQLPDAHADFIFAVAGEELGLLWSGLIILLFVFIVLRGFFQLYKNEDIFTVLAGGGLLAQFGIQALIHMGSSLQLLPAKGMTLPFISYGGSSLLAMGFGMGMVLALTRRRKGPAYARRSLKDSSGLRAPSILGKTQV